MRIKLSVVLCLFVTVFAADHLFARDEIKENAGDIEEYRRLEKIIVEGEKATVSNKMVFTEDLKNKMVAGDPKNVMDLLDDASIIDYRGQSDLGPTGQAGSRGNYFVRGFTGSRFTSAINGISQMHTPMPRGGRDGNLNFDFIPAWLMESVEIIPGPHSALYLGKSIGGVLNFKTAAPKVTDTLKPDIGLSTSYRSYNSQNHNANIRGGVNHLTYGAGFQYSSTDGYLRNNESSLQNLFGYIGYAFDNGGFITFSTTNSESEYEMPVKNYVGIGSENSIATYDNDYPIVTGSTYYNWQKPEREEKNRNYFVNMELPTMIGTFSGGAYTTKDTRYETYLKKSNDTAVTVTDTTSRAHGGRIQDEIAFSENHKTTIAYDLTLLRGGGVVSPNNKKKRVEIKGGALEHEWHVSPSLTLTLGARYEHVQVYMVNSPSKPVTGFGDEIPKSWEGIAPKSILTYGMDNIAPWLRDTSLMLGVSRIWHAPDIYYNSQRTPKAIYTDPEHGMAYDLIFIRRLFGDFNVNLGYSFMRINDYMVDNRSFSEYQPISSVDQSLWYKNFLLNCDAMDRHGMDIAFKGDINRNLKLSLSYSYQKFTNRGDEPAGEQAASDKAKHRAKAKLRYRLFQDLFLNAEYAFQSRQVETTYEEVDKDVFVETRAEIDPHHTVNMGLSYRIGNELPGSRNATLKIYVNNLFNEEYENARGYPMTDQTVGISLGIDL